MSKAFRELLRKVGSGAHTNEPLSRAEAAAATEMMLRQEATPAQIGAFMIAHRIRRPTGEELAGMLDAYDRLGGRLAAIAAEHPTVVMGNPYDGRSRTAPVSVVVSLILASAGCPVVQHGGRRMPTKEGLPLAELWLGLGVDWSMLSLAQVQQVFAQTRLGFVYLPLHFPEAEGLVPYREQIGKRPPFATVELFWCPYDGEALTVSGFVHPPTEEMAKIAFALRGGNRLITVKGLEGSCDLPRDRTCILGIHNKTAAQSFDRLLLHPRDYGFAGNDVALPHLPQLIADLQAVLQGEDSELAQSVIWSSGFYLWQAGAVTNLETGLATARSLLAEGQVAHHLKVLVEAIAAINQPNLASLPS